MRKLFRGCLLAALFAAASACSGAAPGHVRAGATSGRAHSYGDAQIEVAPLTQGQTSSLAKNGFVIASGAPVTSFHYGYTGLFKAHEPVYFTADAILHALHRSFDHILLDTETWSLSKELGTLLGGLRAGLRASAEGSPQARADLDTYLGVAASLLRGAPEAPVAGAPAEAIATLVRLSEQAPGAQAVELFGRTTEVDFSMMTPRGHYTATPELERYFRAMMWLGRVEIRLTAPRSEDNRPPPVERRALEAATLLSHLVTGRPADAWRRIEGATQAFIGPPDSMSFPGFGRAMRSLGAATFDDLSRLGDDAIRRAFAGEAAQKIGTQLLHPGEAPLALVPLGQRYVFDSHVFSEVTYGHLKVKRMMPSTLDVASAVFHHPAATALLAPEFARYYGYRSALEDVGRRGDAMGPGLWQGSLAHLWLGALRELSPDERRDAKLPAVMRTEAWGRRLLNTQLASWAELRHDTLLYAKQSDTAMALCGYPDAYVDPYPGFYASVEAYARKGAALVSALDFGAAGAVKAKASAYFGQLERVAASLRAIAETERRDEPLRPEQLDFLNRAVSIDGKMAGCTMIYEANGWYADLHYDHADALSHPATIADVHTQPTDEFGNMVGKVLHVATGAPRPFAVTIDTCAGPRTFRGFVSSYFERVTEKFQRLNDEEWQVELAQRPPPDVAWLGPLVAR